MPIKIQRIYSKEDQPGIRILVDRLWPRGISKADARLFAWFRDVAPSDELRREFSHMAEKFGIFREKYLAELRNNPDFQKLLEICRNSDVVLLYSATDTEHNNAVVLKEALEKELGPVE